MVKQNNLMDKLLFPGAGILYILLSIVCLFFFFFFFGKGEEFVVFNEKTPILLNWYVFAVFGFIFCSLCGIIRKWWGWRFLATSTILLFFSFLTLQVNLYHIFKDSVILLLVSIVCSIYCCNKLMKSTVKGKVIWGLPMLVFVLYYVFGNIPTTLLSCLISLVVIAILETLGRKKVLKVLAPMGVMAFYILATLTYFPYNPFISSNKIKSIGISFQPRISEKSFQPRITSLVVERDNKYCIIDGITGENPVNAKFDCWGKIPGYVNAFVGFYTNKFKESESKAFHQINDYPFPIILRDSCVYFTSLIETYKVLNGYLDSTDVIKKHTAQIFYDFISIYQGSDTVHLEELGKHQHSLQEEFEKATTDSLKFTNRSANSVKNLKEFSKNLSLGILNSLCADLITNSDINSAISVFSYQFFFTFFDTPIYDRNIISFNVNIDKRYGDILNSYSYRFTPEELRREDTFEPWGRLVSMSVSLAELYLAEIQSENQKNVVESLKRMFEMMQTSFNKENMVYLNNQLRDIHTLLSSYQKTPNIKQYATRIQHFLYSCILNNYMPDYNSFFLNRFNEITPMVPLNPESESAYESMSNLYSSRFMQNIKDVKELGNAIKALNVEIERAINLQDSIDKKIQQIGLILH